METINSCRFCFISSYVGFLQPFHHLQMPALSPRHLLSSTPSKHNQCPFHRRLPKPALALKPITITRSLLDEGSSEPATTKVVEVDPSSAVKRKAAEIGPELKGTSVFLVGINSTIKSSLGKLLADALRYYYFDSDTVVEEVCGGNAAVKSFRESGEQEFRDSETEVLKQLSTMGRLVVCAGNGAVHSAANLALLRHGITIWIDVPLDVVAKEVMENMVKLPVSEPSTFGSYSDALIQLTALNQEMQGGYATADTTVSLQKVAYKFGYDDFNQVTVEDMTLEVLKEIEKLMRVKKMMEEAARPF